MSGLIKIVEIPIPSPSMEEVPDEPPTLEAIGTALKGRPGPGVPAGGETGDLLARAEGPDFSGEWVDPASLPISNDAQAALDEKADISSAFHVVNHGSTASTARPAGAPAVYWIGSVEPANAEDGDLWIGGAA